MTCISGLAIMVVQAMRRHSSISDVPRAVLEYHEIYQLQRVIPAFRALE